MFFEGLDNVRHNPVTHYVLGTEVDEANAFHVPKNFFDFGEPTLLTVEVDLALVTRDDGLGAGQTKDVLGVRLVASHLVFGIGCVGSEEAPAGYRLLAGPTYELRSD